MKTVSLTKVTEIVMGQSPPSSVYNSVGEGLPFFQGKTDFGDLYPTVRLFCTEPKKVAEPNDILISVRAPVGPTNLCSTQSCIGRGLAAIRCSEEVDLYYLLYFLRFNEPKLAQLGQGSTFQAINRDDLKEIQVPLPPLEEQKRIAEIARKCDRIRRIRGFSQQNSDTYLRSAFLKTFEGYLDEYPSTALGEIVTITGGGTPSRDIPEHFEGLIPWLTSKDMKGDYIFDTQEHITEEAIRKSATKLVPRDSILLVVKSKVLMHRLPLAIAKVDICHGQDIKSIQCSSKANPYFLMYLLKHYEKQLLIRARGANTEGLTLPMLEAIPVPNVDIMLQEKFAQVVKRFERIRTQQREAERQAEHLFQTVLHRAFQGEL